MPMVMPSFRSPRHAVFSFGETQPSQFPSSFIQYGELTPENNDARLLRTLSQSAGLLYQSVTGIRGWPMFRSIIAHNSS